MASLRIWVYDGILASGVAAPVDVFTAANHFAAIRTADQARSRRAALTWRIESPDGRPVRTASGQIIAVDGAIDGRKRSDAIFVTAPFVADMDRFMASAELVRTLASAIGRQHKAGTLVATYCTGAYLLAEAGLLDGRIATTHWNRARDFAKRYPKVELRAHEVLVAQDRILCSGAVTSFLALAVRLVSILAGPDLAGTTANALLIDPRGLSQAPYIDLLNDHGHADRLVARAQRRMEETLQQGFSLPDIASYLGVSERTLNRHFKQAIGDTPLGYLQTLRVEVAKRLLEAGTMTFDDVSLRVGYQDPGTFRDLFKRRTGLSPGDYRRRFLS